MQSWGWAIASVILLVTLVQLLAYYYLVRGGRGQSVLSSSTEGNRSTGGVSRREALGAPDEREPTGPGVDEDVRRCSNCGAHNESDPIYTFCRNCGAQL